MQEDHMKKNEYGNVYNVLKHTYLMKKFLVVTTVWYVLYFQKVKNNVLVKQCYM